MNIVGSALLVFVWNELPYAILNIFGLILLLFQNFSKQNRVHFSRIFFTVFVFMLGAVNLTSNVVFSSGLGSGYFWFWAMGLLFLFNFSGSETKSCIVSITTTIFLIAFYDAYLRLNLLASSPWAHLHAYKFGNIGVDTNYTGFMLVLVYALILISKDEIFGKINRRLILVLFLTLIILSFSRSAWIVTAILTFCFIMRSRPFILIISFVTFILIIALFVFTDESLLSKFEILQLVLSDFESWEYYNYLLGRGGNVDLGGKTLHILLLQVVYQAGFFGLLLFVIFAAILFRFNVRYSLAAYFLLGVSFVPLTSPLLCLSFVLESAMRRNNMAR